MTTTTIPGIVLDQTVARLLFIREQEKQMVRERKLIEQQIIALFADEDIDSFQTNDDVRVNVESRPRRSFNVDVLSANLPPTVVASLLKQDVDGTALDAAVTAGVVPADVADNATEISYSTQVRVYGEKGVREA